MSELRKQVREFHEVMGQPVRYRPEAPSEERVRLRMALIAEEFLEVICTMFDPEGWNPNLAGANAELREIFNHPDFKVRIDMVGLAKELADLDYVIEGTRLEFGIDGDPIADEVHRSNMSKMGTDGKFSFREDGKVLKGPNYQPPAIESLLLAQGWTP